MVTLAPGDVLGTLWLPVWLCIMAATQWHIFQTRNEFDHLIAAQDAIAQSTRQDRTGSLSETTNSADLLPAHGFEMQIYTEMKILSASSRADHALPAAASVPTPADGHSAVLHLLMVVYSIFHKYGLVLACVSLTISALVPPISLIKLGYLLQVLVAINLFQWAKFPRQALSRIWYICARLYRSIARACACMRDICLLASLIIFLSDYLSISLSIHLSIHLSVFFVFCALKDNWH